MRIFYGIYQKAVSLCQRVLGRVSGLMRGEVRPTGRLIARKISKDKGEVENLEVNVGDSLARWKDRRAARRQGGTSEAIRVGDSEGRSSADDVSENGMVAFSIEGKSRQGEEGSLQVAQTLIKQFNQDGASWDGPQKPDREEGVDWESRDGKHVLKIQVTRAEINQTFWETLNRTGAMADQSEVVAIADQLRDAIKNKEPRSSKDVVLALDAMDTPRHAVPVVVEAFRNRYGEWARQIGFREIWVVGPIDGLTARLDVP